MSGTSAVERPATRVRNGLGRRLTTLATALLLVGAAACSSSSGTGPGGDGTSTGSATVSSSPGGPTTATTPPATGTPSNTASGSPTAEPTAAILDDGRHPVRVMAVEASTRRLTVDVVQFFTGDAASVAAEEDGSTELPPPNDYWIRNESRRLRTLPVWSGAKITVNTLAALESGSSTTNVPKTLAELARLRGLSGALFWVTVSDGRVVRIQEQFLP